MCYANRYYRVLESGNIGQLNSIPSTIRPEAIKSLIVISKHIGCYEAIQGCPEKLRNQVRPARRFAAFVRIYSNTNNNLDEWFAKVKPILTPQENLLLKFLRLTGLRCSEGIESFNLIIELSAKEKLHEYLKRRHRNLRAFQVQRKVSARHKECLHHHSARKLNQRNCRKPTCNLCSHHQKTSKAKDSHCESASSGTFTAPS